MKSYRVATQMKAKEQYFPVVLFIMLASFWKGLNMEVKLTNNDYQRKKILQIRKTLYMRKFSQVSIIKCTNLHQPIPVIVAVKTEVYQEIFRQIMF